MVLCHGSTLTVTSSAGFCTHDMEQGSTHQQHPVFEHQWNVTMREEGKMEELVTAIWNKAVVAVSDGSFLNSNGAVAWAIKGYSASHQI